MAQMKLEIILNDNGSITVNGPLQNKLICWGLLEAASDVIRTYQPEARPLIEVPSIEMPTDMRGPVGVER